MKGKIIAIAGISLLALLILGGIIYLIFFGSPQNVLQSGDRDIQVVDVAKVSNLYTIFLSDFSQVTLRCKDLLVSVGGGIYKGSFSLDLSIPEQNTICDPDRCFSYQTDFSSLSSDSNLEVITYDFSQLSITHCYEGVSQGINIPVTNLQFDCEYSSGKINCNIIGDVIHDANLGPPGKGGGGAMVSFPSGSFTIEDKLCIQETGTLCNPTIKQTSTYSDSCEKANLISLGYTSDLTECQEDITPDPPTPPQPNGWTWFKNLILNLIQAILSIFKSQTIVGEVSVAPGSIQTYNINLLAPTPDSDYSDGYFETQYANWILSDEDGNKVQEGTWETVKGSYIKSVTITVPDVEDKNYMIASIITQINGTYNYNTGTWTWTEETPIVQEGIDIKTKYSISPPVAPLPSGFAKLWSAIKDLFCKLLPFLCS